MTETLSPRPTRRAVTRSMGWAAPVLVVGAAAPLSAASEDGAPVTKCYRISWTAADVGTDYGASTDMQLVAEDGSVLYLRSSLSPASSWNAGPAGDGRIPVDWTVRTSMDALAVETGAPLSDKDDGVKTPGVILTNRGAVAGRNVTLTAGWDPGVVSDVATVTSMSLTIEDLDRGAQHCSALVFSDPIRVSVPDGGNPMALGNLDQEAISRMRTVTPASGVTGWAPYTVQVTPSRALGAIAMSYNPKYCVNSSDAANISFIKITQITVCAQQP